MKRIIFVTGNKGKLAEIEKILKDLDYEVVSMKDAGVSVDIDENGSTFEENAMIKARAVHDATGEMTMADDSGLEIDALDGRPGIYSARFMGEDTPYSVKNKALIDALKGVPDEKRTARFVCACALVLPDGTGYTVRGTFEGRIGYEEKGSNGFGYDPIFFLPERGCTSAELSPEDKNEISHRGQALRKMKEIIKDLEEGKDN